MWGRGSLRTPVANRLANLGDVGHRTAPHDDLTPGNLVVATITPQTHRRNRTAPQTCPHANDPASPLSHSRHLMHGSCHDPAHTCSPLPIAPHTEKAVTGKTSTETWICDVEDKTSPRLCPSPLQAGQTKHTYRMKP